MIPYGYPCGFRVLVNAYRHWHGTTRGVRFGYSILTESRVARYSTQRAVRVFIAFIVSRGVRRNFSVGKAKAAHLVATPLDNPPAILNTLAEQALTTHPLVSNTTDGASLNHIIKIIS